MIGPRKAGQALTGRIDSLEEILDIFISLNMPSNIPSNVQPLVSGSIYHVYNRAVGDETLFRKEEKR